MKDLLQSLGIAALFAFVIAVSWSFGGYVIDWLITH